MRKKLAGIHLLAPLSESDITDLSRNLDRELIINTTPVTDAVIDTYEKTNYIVTFEYDTTLDGGTNRIRRSIPTLELLGNTDANVSGTHWINLEDKDYHYIDDGATAQLAFEQLDEQLTKVCYLKHIRDTEGIGSIVSSDDGTVLSSVVDDSIYAIVLGGDHTLDTSNYGVIMGGYSSRMSSSAHSNILNGYNNYIYDAYNSSIYGGYSNIIGTDALLVFILAGKENAVYNSIESGIIGGHDNYIYKNVTDSYGSFVFGSVYGYIEDGNFSAINNSATSYIYGGKYSGINLSSYIEIGDSTDALVSISTNSSIGKSTFANIIASTYTTKNLTIYNSTAVSIESSTNSYIWHSENASISASVDSSLGYYILPNSVDSISKTTIRLGVSDITDFKIGQLVKLTGAEFTSYTEEYRIYDIDVPNKFLYFVDKNSTQVNFNTSNTDAITIKVINTTNTSTSIISNTNDTVVCATTIDTSTAVGYIVIGNSLNRYTVVSVSGQIYTNTVKLKLYGTDTIITNLTPNALTGLTISTYYTYNNIDTSFIAGSVNSNAYYGNTISILSAYNGIVQSGSRGALIATTDASMNSFSNTVIMGGIDHYVSGVTDAIIIGGNRNYIASTSQCNIIGGYDNKIICATNCGIILGDANYITNCTNVAVIACDHHTVQFRSNALITNSLTLVDRTFELTDNTPHTGDVLVVDYVTSGNIAKVKWGSYNSPNTLLSSTVYTLHGSSLMYMSMGDHYISLNLDDTAIAGTGIDVGMTITGYDYDIFWRKSSDSSVPENLSDISGNLRNSTDGILIENGYRYQIVFNSFDIGWGGSKSANTPDLTMSCSTTINIKANPTPSDYIIEYSVNGGSYTPLVTVYSDLYGWMVIDGLSGTNIDTPKISGLYKRANAESSGYLTLLVSDIQQKANYALPEDVQYYYSIGSGNVMVIWPSTIDLPTSEQISNSACILMKGRKYWSSVDNDWTGEITTSDGNWERLSIVSVISEGSRIVQLGNGGDPGNSAMLTAKLWTPAMGPRLSVSTQVSVTKISETFANMFG